MKLGNDAAMTPAERAMFEVSHAVNGAEYEWKRQAEMLAAKMEELARDMTRQAERIRAQLATGEIISGLTNSLGAVQSSGTDIDMRCASLESQARQVGAARFIANHVRAALEPAAPTEPTPEAKAE